MPPSDERDVQNLAQWVAKTLDSDFIEQERKGETPLNERVPSRRENLLSDVSRLVDAAENDIERIRIECANLSREVGLLEQLNHFVRLVIDQPQDLTVSAEAINMSPQLRPVRC